MAESKLLTEGEKIDLLISRVIRLIDEQGMKRDWRGSWFSNKLLDSVRNILERRGLRSAQVFLSGKLDPRTDRFEKIRDQVLLDVLREIETLSLDIKMASYVVGKLNFIIDEKRKEKSHEKS